LVLVESDNAFGGLEGFSDAAALTGRGHRDLLRYCRGPWATGTSRVMLAAGEINARGRIDADPDRHQWIHAGWLRRPARNAADRLCTARSFGSAPWISSPTTRDAGTVAVTALSTNATARVTSPGLDERPESPRSLN
jgi:hypothetical protein